MVSGVNSTELSEFYRKTLDMIYAFVIGQSFLSIDPLLKSITNIFEPTNAIDIAAVSFAYFVLIFGWVQHHKSITNKPHIGKFGNARYALDLITVFLTYYLLSISKPDAEVQYGEVFLWTLPVIFFVYSVWDALKYYEYYSIPKARVSTGRLLITLVFGFSFILLGCFYYMDVESIEKTYHNFWSNKTAIDPYYIAISFVLMGYYRLRKWHEQDNNVS